MYLGYRNRILEVDLGAHRAWVWRPPDPLWESFLGGKGVGLKLLYDRALRAEPFSLDNLLIFMAGAVTGSPVPTSARSCVVFKSPLTGSAVDSHAGGAFGPALKRAGYDGLVVRGRAEKPLYAHITPEGCSFHDAGSLWGQGILATEKKLRELYPNAQVAAIGPAGENQVRFACISTALYRQFGRGGAGAVMGTKNLKAIVVEGDLPITVAHEETFRELNAELALALRDHPMRKRRYELGTAMWIRMAQEAGFLPTRNFRECRFEEFAGITAEAMRQELSWKSVGCWGCPIRCAKLAKWDGQEIEGPEYETAAFLGSGCGIGQAKAVAAANLLCDDLGLDTISTGVVASFAMEAYERGLLGDADGLDLSFGQSPALFALIEKIAKRQGIGDMLAEGTRIAAQALGQGAEYFAIQVGGMELSGVNPKGCASMGLSLATADFASHTRFWSATAEMQGALTIEDVPRFVKEGQDEVAARNSLIVCDFLPFGFEELGPIFSALTGMAVSPASLRLAGERIENLHRLFNVENGRTRAQDVLPERFFAEEHEAGLFSGRRMSRADFNRWLDAYYEIRGWDRDGRPTPKKLTALGLA